MGFKLILFVIVVAIIVAICGYVLFLQKTPTQIPPPTTIVATTTSPQACSQLAKKCSDGSYVGPTGPNCVFVCPVFPTNTSTSITTSTITPTTTSTASHSIYQLNTPGSVLLRQGDIAEVRNENFYFTLQRLASSFAFIQITPVGCWNSFPSDTPPRMRCMIATVPIPPQTFSIGQTYNAANYHLTLTQIANATATFLVN